MSDDATLSGDPQTPTGSTPVRTWKPLNSIQRRVAGVLVEKAKTTPEQYPMSLNALVNGCNQKSTRDQQMNLSADRVEQALEDLRQLGAVIEVQSGGRVAKFKHCLYEWLAVDKAELAVMAELLLRREQTVGELRGRAARMEPIADLAALQPLLRSLIQKGLVVELTAEGRGQLVTHALYPEKDLSELREQVRNSDRPLATCVNSSAEVSADALERLQTAVAEMRTELDELKEQVRMLLQ